MKHIRNDKKTNEESQEHAIVDCTIVITARLSNEAIESVCRETSTREGRFPAAAAQLVRFVNCSN